MRKGRFTFGNSDIDYIWKKSMTPFHTGNWWHGDSYVEIIYVKISKCKSTLPHRMVPFLYFRQINFEKTIRHSGRDRGRDSGRHSGRDNDWHSGRDSNRHSGRHSGQHSTFSPYYCEQLKESKILEKSPVFSSRTGIDVFLGYGQNQNPPNHTTWQKILSRNRLKWLIFGLVFCEFLDSGSWYRAFH